VERDRAQAPRLQGLNRGHDVARDCAWSSAGESERRGYVKLHAPFNLETGAVETFKATNGTERECRHPEGLLEDLEDIECFVADNTIGGF